MRALRRPIPALALSAALACGERTTGDPLPSPKADPTTTTSVIEYTGSTVFVASPPTWTTTTTTTTGDPEPICPDPRQIGSCAARDPSEEPVETEVIWRFSWGSGLPSEVSWRFEGIEDEADLALLEGSVQSDTEPLPVDFSTHRVVLLGYRRVSTCGMIELSAEAWPGPTAVLTIEDTSADCCEKCDAEQSIGVALAIPRTAGDTPAGCVEVIGGCLL